jgi:hypothetical protein
LDSCCRRCCYSYPCSPVAFVVAPPWSLILPDLLRSAVILSLVSLQGSVAAVLFCTCSDTIVCSGVVWVCLARKGRICLLWFHRGCGTWICLCCGRFIRHSIPNKCSHIIFCYLVSRPYAGSLGSVRCVCACFGFSFTS